MPEFSKARMTPQDGSISLNILQAILMPLSIFLVFMLANVSLMFLFMS